MEESLYSLHGSNVLIQDVLLHVFHFSDRVLLQFWNSGKYMYLLILEVHVSVFDRFRIINRYCIIVIINYYYNNDNNNGICQNIVTVIIIVIIVVIVIIVIVIIVFIIQVFNNIIWLSPLLHITEDTPSVSIYNSNITALCFTIY